jgi:ubiquinone/menaquinone biosynthesis C-methylase UbiE
MEISSRIAAAYDEVASSFAEKNAAMPDSFLELGPRFLAQVRSGTVVLDVGCGAGRDVNWLQQQGASIVGGDRSAGMLAQAGRFAPGRLVQLDMRSLPFPDGAFGGVWCSASLLHLPKQEAPGALSEMHRVLAARGPLLLSIQEGDGEVWEPSPYDAPVERFFARYRQAEAEALVTAAGFVIQERLTGESPNRRWLQYLATRTI